MKSAVKILIFCIGLCFSCEEPEHLDKDCIQGRIVGQKCNVFALQLPGKILGATQWQKEPLGDAGVETFDNVIGLIGLPAEFGVEGKTLFVSLRKPTDEERKVPCYLDLPGPPEPFYVILSVSQTSCSEAVQISNHFKFKIQNDSKFKIGLSILN